MSGWTAIGWRSKAVIGVLFALMLVWISTGTVAGQPAPNCSEVSYDGDGTTESPYEVENVDQLQCIEDQALDANYVQVSDIDASGTENWNDGKGFAPVGENSPEGLPFSGSFDGGGHDITGLSIDRSDEDGVGIFGAVNNSGTVESISVTDATITGNSSVGGVVGRNNGTVSESSASGNATGSSFVGVLVGEVGNGSVSGSSTSGNATAADFDVGNLVGAITGNGTVSNSSASGDARCFCNGAGGLVGENRDGGRILRSSASGDATGEVGVGGLVGGHGGVTWDSSASGDATGDRNVGGLVGFNAGGEVSNSSASGDATAGRNVGGLLGGNDGVVSNSSSSGDATGETNVGGLVGGINGTVSNTYATGDVAGNTTVGGVVGLNFGGTVEYSYATGNVTGNDSVGGILGQSGGDAFTPRNGSPRGGFDGVLRGSYWDTETTGQSEAIGQEGGDDLEGNEGGESVTEGEIESLTTTEMTGEKSRESMSAFNFGGTWATVTNPDGYPILVWQTEGEVEDTSEVEDDGSEEDDESGTSDSEEGMSGFTVIATLVLLALVGLKRTD